MTNLSDLFGSAGSSGGSTPSYTNTYTASATWTIDHNLATYDIIVQCWSSDTANAEQLFPESITSTTANQTVIDWGDQSVAGQVRITTC